MSGRRNPGQFVESLGEWLSTEVQQRRQRRDDGVIDMAVNGRGPVTPRLCGVRHRAGLSRRELALRAGIDYAVLVLLENGLLPPGSLPGDARSRLAAVLSTRPEQLFAPEDRGWRRTPARPHLVRRNVAGFYSIFYERLPDAQEQQARALRRRRLRRLSVFAIVGLLLASVSSNLPEVGYWTGVWVASHIDWPRLCGAGFVMAGMAWRGLGAFGEWALSAQTRAWTGTPIAWRPALGVLMALWLLLALIGCSNLFAAGRLLRHLGPRRAPSPGPVRPDLVSQSSGG